MLAHRLARGPAARFFVAVFLSLYGDWLTTVALLVVLFQLTQSPLRRPGYMLVRVAPRVSACGWGAALLTAVAADRHGAASVAQAIFTLSLIASHRTGAVWAIYVAVAAAQFSGALGRPSQGAILPSLVSDGICHVPTPHTGCSLAPASSWLRPSVRRSLIRAGPDPFFAVDAATFVVCATGRDASRKLPRRKRALAGRARVGGRMAGPGIALWTPASANGGGCQLRQRHDGNGHPSAPRGRRSRALRRGRCGWLSVRERGRRRGGRRVSLRFRWIPPRSWTRFGSLLCDNR